MSRSYPQWRMLRRGVHLQKKRRKKKIQLQLLRSSNKTQMMLLWRKIRFRWRIHGLQCLVRSLWRNCLPRNGLSRKKASASASRCLSDQIVQGRRRRLRQRVKSPIEQYRTKSSRSLIRGWTCWKWHWRNTLIWLSMAACSSWLELYSMTSSSESVIITSGWESALSNY